MGKKMFRKQTADLVNKNLSAPCFDSFIFILCVKPTSSETLGKIGEDNSIYLVLKTDSTYEVHISLYFIGTTCVLWVPGKFHQIVLGLNSSSTSYSQPHTYPEYKND